MGEGEQGMSLDDIRNVLRYLETAQTFLDDVVPSSPQEDRVWELVKQARRAAEKVLVEREDAARIPRSR